MLNTAKIIQDTTDTAADAAGINTANRVLDLLLAAFEPSNSTDTTEVELLSSAEIAAVVAASTDISLPLVAIIEKLTAAGFVARTLTPPSRGLGIYFPANLKKQ